MPINTERLESYIGKIDESLGKTQISSRLSSATDLHFMPSLIQMVNTKKKGINAHFANDPNEFVEIVNNLIENQILNAKIIVNLEFSRIHFIAFDVCIKEGNISLIGFESATLVSLGASMLAFQCHVLLSKIPKLVLAIIEMDLQRSNGECGIFSLAMIKTMHKEQKQMEILHERNIKKDLPITMGIIIPIDNANKLLPPSFMKHSQSMRRLKRYLKAYDGAEHTVINKKGETLLVRQQRFFGQIQVNEKTISQSYSIETKRQKEMVNLLHFAAEYD